MILVVGKAEFEPSQNALEVPDVILPCCILGLGLLFVVSGQCRDKNMAEIKGLIYIY